MDEMGTLFQLGHLTPENMMQKGGCARVWAAMLLKNYRDYPIKESARVRWPQAIFPAHFLLHARQLLGHTAVRFGHANPDINLNVRAIGLRGVNVSRVHSPGFPGCWLTVPW